MSNHDSHGIVHLYVPPKGPALRYSGTLNPPHLHLESRWNVLKYQIQSSSGIRMHTFSLIAASWHLQQNALFRLRLSLLSLCIFVAMAETRVWLDARAGSDKRAECFCTGKPLGQAPVGAHQSEVSTVGMVGGRKRKRRGWGGVKEWQWATGYDNGDIFGRRTSGMGGAWGWLRGWPMNEWSVVAWS